MARSKEGVEKIAVSTNTTIKTTSCIYYGCLGHSLTTGTVHGLIYDAKATAQGVIIDVMRVAGGTNTNILNYYPNGIIMHSGIHLQASICTSGSDDLIIYYGA